MAVKNLGRVGFVLRGDYDAAQTYKRLDCVRFGTTTYAAKKDVPAGVAVTNETYWQKLVNADAIDNFILVQEDQPTDPDNKLWVKELTEEIDVPTREAFEALAGKVDEKTVKHLLSYDGTSIKEGTKVLTHDEIYNMLMDTPAFVVLVYQDHAYHPNTVTTSQIIFIASNVSGGYEEMDRITISSNDVVTVTYGKAEMTANKTGVINDTNKDDNDKYPSLKAVADYVDAFASKKMSYVAVHTATVSGNTVLQDKDGTTMTFEQLRDIYLADDTFLYVISDNVIHIPAYLETHALAFAGTYIIRGEDHIRRVIINDENVVQVNDHMLELADYKAVDMTVEDWESLDWTDMDLLKCYPDLKSMYNLCWPMKEELASLRDDLAQLDGKINDYTPIDTGDTSNANRGLRDAYDPYPGLSFYLNNNQLDKYPVLAGKKIRIKANAPTSGATYQFSTSSKVNFNTGTSYIVGDPVSGHVNTEVVVPDTASWLIISRGTLENAAFVAYVTNEIDKLNEKDAEFDDKIESLMSAFYTKVNADSYMWEQGLINANGVTSSSNIRIRTKEGLRVEPGCRIESVEGFAFGVFIYADQNCTMPIVIIPVSSAVTNYVTEVNGYLKICLLKTDGTRIYPSDYIGALQINGLIKGTYEIELEHKPDKCWSFTGDVDRSILDADDRLSFMYDKFDDLVSRYPNQITMENLGDVPGAPNETLELRAYTFRACQAAWAKKLPKIIFIASIHGAEPNTLVSTIHMAEALVSQRDSDPTIQMLMANTQIVLIPAMCPYSVKYKGRCNGRIYEYNGNTYTGVNLNRNFNANWAQIWPASPTTSHTSSDYSGTGPESEPETAIIAEYLRNSTDCLFAINKHDNSNLCDVSNDGVETGCEDIALCSNNWLSDIAALKRAFKPLETMFRAKYPWIVSDRKDGLNYNPGEKIMCEARTPAATTGTMDKYFSMLGIHGGIIEVAKYAGSAYNDPWHYDDMAKIHTEVNINYMAALLMANKELLSDKTPAQQYVIA